jgi:transcriptional regulator with XRE-family HTH domain
LKGSKKNRGGKKMVERKVNKTLKITLVQKDFTNRKLAALAGIPESTLSMILRGILIPTPQQQKKIADVLECSPREIF